MPNFDELIHGKEAAGLMKDPAKLEKLRDAPETQQIFRLLSQSAGDLEGAAQRAAQGDAAQLTRAIRQLMQDPEGAKLIQKMKENFK
ncbi:MAG: hypothetical protein HFF26_01755 [Oscillospiraceae bacterium]|nr:hypothetical protein [Oscillospiraceae bacterium]MDE6841350.1 hypothetical protein [Oscillospiraceae bacterium]